MCVMLQQVVPHVRDHHGYTKLRLSLLPNHAIRQRNVIRSVGCTHSSEEVSVMEMEPRGTVIQY